MRLDRVSSFGRAVHRLALAAVGLALGGGTLAAQTTGKIEGRVRDQVGAPIANAQVFIAGTAFNALTNPQGYYFINNVPPGDISVRAAFIGYKLSSKVLCTSPPWLSTAQLGQFPPSWHTSGTQITTAATACMFSSAILAAGTPHIESPNDLVATTPPSRSPISFPSCAHCAAKQRRIPPSERGVPGFARSKAALHAGNIPRSSLAG
jgi:Carboxypeptidase regulatory-like domain